jgi:hypothetical protein
MLERWKIGSNREREKNLNTVIALLGKAKIIER